MIRRRSVRASIALAIAGCSMTLAAYCNGCPEYPCAPQVNLGGWCADQGTCELDGWAVTTCASNGETPECPLWNLRKNVTLKIPIEAFWPDSQNRNDLRIVYPSLGASELAPDMRKARILFDGEPESHCTRDAWETQCLDLPPDLSVIEFRYEDGETIGDRLRVYIVMVDHPCEDEHPVCPR